jgi:hypothetical protein
MDSVKDWIQIAMFSVAVVGWLYAMLKKVENPDLLADKRLSKLETIFPINNLSIEERFKLMNEKSLAIDNHLRHIESDMSDIKKDIAIILDRELQIRKQLS